MKKLSSKKGYTLAEMVLVVAIITMFSGVALFGVGKSYGDYLERAKLSADRARNFEPAAQTQMNRDNSATRDIADSTNPFAGFDILINNFERLDGGHFTEFNTTIEDTLSQNGNGKQEFINSIRDQVADALGTDDYFCQAINNRCTIYTDGQRVDTGANARNPNAVKAVIVSADTDINPDSTVPVMVFVFDSQGNYLYAGTGTATMTASRGGVAVENGTINDFSVSVG